MTLEKEFQNFIHLQGKLPEEIKREAYELFYMGVDISEIDFVIKNKMH